MVYVGQNVRIQSMTTVIYEITLHIPDANRILSSFPTQYSLGYTFRCDTRRYTILTAFPALMLVELILMLRVLVLCESIKPLGKKSSFICPSDENSKVSGLNGLMFQIYSRSSRMLNISFRS